MLSFATNIPVSGFADRCREGYYRNALVNELSKLFYVNEPGTLISNGLSTELIVFPSDLDSEHQTYLQQKIRSALGYATVFKDIEEFYALVELAPKGKFIGGKDYPALGLYLYFADECSRLRPDTTFLAELRKSKVGLKSGENPNKAELLERFKIALRNLGMDKTHGPVLEEWAQAKEFEENIGYTIHGEWNGFDNATQTVQGTYAKLAQYISKQQPVFGMNLAISYALGNKARIEKLNTAYPGAMTPEEESESARKAFEFTRAIVSHSTKDRLDERITDNIARGNKEREARIRAIIDEQVRPLLPNNALAKREEAKQMAHSVLETLPLGALELLYREGYTLAYTNTSTIKDIYPKEDLFGVTAKANEISRTSKALRIYSG